mmetsp:Transcript_22618/g.33913  ORF Transcript_22618/g.33913 Transcript_22618/m.33913 type:complete len:98 (-) Transcript_22618:94-387(-)
MQSSVHLLPPYCSCTPDVRCWQGVLVLHFPRGPGQAVTIAIAIAIACQCLFSALCMPNTASAAHHPPSGPPRAGALAWWRWRFQRGEELPAAPLFSF